MISAREAKKAAEAHHQRLVDEHAKEYAKVRAEERRKINTLIGIGRWDEIVARVEQCVRSAAAEGCRDLSYMEHGGFYLQGEDRVLFEDLKYFFAGQGYTIKEYQGYGMQLQW